MKFRELAENYLLERANYKHSTLRSYRSILDAHLLPAFGETEAEDVSESQIRMFQMDLAKTVAGSRVNTICQLLRSILSEAYRRSVIELDPTKAVRKVRQTRTKIEPFSDEEIEKIFAALDKFYIPFFKTLLHTGMRPNEAYALTWDDINLEAGTINIDKGMVEGVEGTTKTESSERVVPMANTLLEYFKTLTPRPGFLFVSKSGGPMTGDIDRVWKRACIKAGVEYRKPYVLRHGYATKALTKGIPIAYVSKLLGHANPGVTLRFYARWVDCQEQEQKIRELM